MTMMYDSVTPVDLYMCLCSVKALNFLRTEPGWDNLEVCIIQDDKV